jgi:hypothetical protein
MLEDIVDYNHSCNNGICNIPLLSSDNHNLINSDLFTSIPVNQGQLLDINFITTNTDNLFINQNREINSNFESNAIIAFDNNQYTENSNNLTDKALEQVYEYFSNLLNDSELATKLKLTFGDHYNKELAEQLITDFSQRNSSILPPVKIVSSETINGANGAYDTLNGLIYLSQEFVVANQDNSGAIASILLEEFGHFIDSRINKSDALGDEGEIFAALVQGKDLSAVELGQIKTDDDTATILLNGQEILIEQNNTLSTANYIGTLSSTRTFNDFVGNSDTNDYYKFYLSSNSNFSLTLSGMTADGDAQLLNSSGAVIQTSTANGSSNDSISRTLNTGYYYVRVYPSSGANTNYNLKLTANRVDNGGNSLSTANYIGNLDGTRIFNDYIGSSDTNDYYKFYLNETRNFSLTLSGMTADGDAQLLNSSGAVIQTSTGNGSSNDSISRTLNTGYYYVRVYPSSGANTNYNLNLTATSDWYTQNLLDSEIRSLTRTYAADGQLSRNDMIGIFRNAKDSNVISSYEFTDLQTIVSNASRFNMQNHVRVLSNKLVNGDLANQKYQGNTLGNLHAGSSATQMENLIGQWFLGLDRPSTTSSSYTYRYTSGSLFQNGISYQDIYQGMLGNCYILCGLSTTALNAPSTIQSMFIYNGDNTYTVRFYKNGVADYVTVDRYLPTDSSGYFVYAHQKDPSWGKYNNSTNELWVALAEKAYAQLNESGWIGQDNTNSYRGIEGGWSGDAIKHITGKNTGYQYLNNFNNLVNAVNADKFTTITSKEYDSQVASNVVPNHEYVITGYNSTTGKFTLFNPWGMNGGSSSNGEFKPGIIELTWTQLTASFQGWTSTV